jgi:hypothetical protein
MILALENEGEFSGVYEVWPDNGEIVVVKDWNKEGEVGEKRFQMQDWKVQSVEMS